MSLAPTAPAALPTREFALPFKLAIAFALAALADWLFYEHAIGISAVIFAIALACGAAIANLADMSKQRGALASVALLAGLVPAIEEVNMISLVLGMLALGASIVYATDPELDNIGQLVTALRHLFLTGPFRFFRDALGVFSLPGLMSGVAVWLVPLGLGAIFVMLLGTANPVIERWIMLLGPAPAASAIGIERPLFWIVALSLVWPFIQIWRRRKPAMPAGLTKQGLTEQGLTGQGLTDQRSRAQEPAIRPSPLLGAAAILRSLVLFNLVFVVQTTLDLIYLWGSVELPAGITYASYAHRGAYALILTALLAAGFVLAAMRPNGPARDVKMIRPLVYLFVAQNILLVASSILRLDLYVEVYLLTGWRIAAFIWMLLVALGLVLIVARIALERPNSWLIRANLIALTAVLYACSLTNFAAIIADYNVTHSREAAGQGATIDINYLLQLGPQALPAIDKTLRLRAYDPFLVARRDRVADDHARQMASWRAWDFRSWRLQRYMTIPQDRSTAGS